MRNIASAHAEKYGQVDLSKSHLKVFPDIYDSEGLWYNLYIQLKDSEGHYVDCDSSEIKVLSNEENVPYRIERVLSGRYYLSIKKDKDIEAGNIKLWIQDQQFSKDSKFFFTSPHKKNSRIKLISIGPYMLTFQLKLADELKRPIALQESPEIILEGLGNVGDLRLISVGVWEFSVIYPEANQIMYFSARAGGVYLPKLFRYQHVEK